MTYVLGDGGSDSLFASVTHLYSLSTQNDRDNKAGITGLRLQESGTINYSASGGPNDLPYASNDSLGDFLDFVNTLGDQADGDWTLDFWFYFDTIAADATIVSGLDIGGGNPNEFTFDADGTANALRLAIRDTTGSTTELQGGSGLSADTWYWAALVRDGTTLRLLIDGSIEDTATIGATDEFNFSLNQPPRIFRRPSGDDSAPAGTRIRDVRFTEAVRYDEAGGTPSSELYFDTLPGDEHYESVVLLLNMAGDDGATDVYDLSSQERTITLAGDAALSNAQTLYQDTALTLDGTGDRISVSDSDDWNPESGAYTAEIRFRMDTLSGGEQRLINQWAGGAGQRNWILQINASDEIELLASGDGNNTDLTLNGGTVSVDTDHEAAWDVDDAGNVRLYLDGAVVATGSRPGDFNDSGQVLSIGSNASSASSGNVDGTIYEARITKGVQRYGGAYTPSGETWHPRLPASNRRRAFF